MYSDYVTLEIARLLENKNFDSFNCRTFYDKNGNLFDDTVISWYAKGSFIKCPTYQAAARWLRETHNLFIKIDVKESADEKTRYCFSIIPINKKIICWENIEKKPPTEDYETPTKACEIAIKYCLENLI